MPLERAAPLLCPYVAMSPSRHLARLRTLVATIAGMGLVIVLPVRGLVPEVLRAVRSWLTG